MSDLVESLGMVFDSAVTGIGDLATSFLSDAAKMFDAGTAALDTQAPDVSAPETPAPETPPTPDTQPPAPVSEGSAPIAGASPAGALQSAPTWFQNLSPGAQAILGKSVSGGAAGLLAALSQKHLLEEQRRREDQQREDKIRRSYVPAISEGAFKPKGVIEAARGG